MSEYKTRFFLVLLFGVLIFAGAVILGSSSSTFGYVLGETTQINDDSLLLNINSARSSNNLTPLEMDSSLSWAAEQKAQHMIDNNYWSHTAPDGTTGWDFINLGDYTFNVGGENLAYGYSTSQALVDGWMASASHRNILLGNYYEDIGFGIATGQFQGAENTVVVALFGDPTEKPSQPKTLASASPETSESTDREVTFNQDILPLEQTGGAASGEPVDADVAPQALGSLSDGTIEELELNSNDNKSDNSIGFIAVFFAGLILTQTSDNKQTSRQTKAR